MHTKQGDPDKIKIVCDTLKDIELVIQTPTIHSIEDLRKDEGIEN